MPRRPVKEATTSGSNVGYGKVILFGEHFVVYGAPAIVAGVSEFTDCKLRVLHGKPGLHVIDKRPAVPGYIKEKRDEQRAAHQLVLDHLKIDLSVDGLEMTLAGPLVPSSGIGASASDVVAFSRALSELYNLNLSEDQVNQSAFVGEGGYHGTPSGVDNTAATFGGLLSYQRTAAGPSFAKLTNKNDLFLVVVGTGITASTTKVLADVKKLTETNPSRFAEIMEAYQKLYANAQNAIKEGNIDRIGQLMDTNHELCQQITVSCPELDTIVRSARAAGAIGAKMSGTGRGGIAVALCRDAANQKSVAAALRSSCAPAKFVWEYKVAAQGSHSKL